MPTKSSRSTSNATVDHDEIRQWVESRGGSPACVRGTGGGGDTGLLRIDFPGYSGAKSLHHISWDEFFEKFDDQNLAFLYQEKTAAGRKSNFNKLISRPAGAKDHGRRPRARAESKSNPDATPSSRRQSRSRSKSSSSSRGKSTSRTSAASQTTTDHDEIRQWVESRGGNPACVIGTGGKADTGLLRIDFPGYSGANSLHKITWKEFFKKFDENNLAFLYQDRTKSGKRSNFNKLVSRNT